MKAASSGQYQLTLLECQAKRREVKEEDSESEENDSSRMYQRWVWGVVDTYASQLIPNGHQASIF